MISEVTVKYDNYSDDGKYFYNGTEYAKGSMMTKTTYTSDVKAVDPSGEEVGMMDISMVFTAPLGIHTITKHLNSPMLDLKKSHAVSSWMGKTADMSALVE